MKKILTMLILFILSIFISGCVKTSDYENALSQVSESQKIIGDLNKNINDLTKMIEDTKTKKDEIESELISTQKNLSEVNDKNTELSQQVKDYRAEIRELESKVNSLVCGHHWDFSFTNDLAMREELVEYTQSARGSNWKVKDVATSRKIWSNSETRNVSVFYCKQDTDECYKADYLVFFSDDGLEFEDAVYSLDDQCSVLPKDN